MTRSRLGPPSVYFIQCRVLGPVKIGMAVDVHRRLRDLQCDNAETAHLLAVIPLVGAHGERSEHLRFLSSRLHGEWFAWSPAMGRRIAAVTRQYGPPPERPLRHRYSRPPPFSSCLSGGGLP